MSLKVTMQNYPTVPSVTRAFSIIIVCQVQSIGFSASTPNSMTVNLGVDAQPFNIPYSVTKTPACVVAPAFTMTPSNLIWLTITKSGDGGNVVVNGAIQANKGTYAVTLNASQDGKTATTVINLVIVCTVNSVDKTGSVGNIVYY